MKLWHNLRVYLHNVDRRHPRLGPYLWIWNIHYFFVQMIVFKYWRGSQFSWLANPISDLGNTACGPYADRLVCSPLHSVMNLSFIVLGLATALGSILIYQKFQRSTVTKLGFGLLVISGLATMLVGIFPENTISAIHGYSAFTTFVVGNLALILLGVALPLVRWLKIYTIASGVVALTALALFVANIRLGIGFGGMERLVAYPQTIWLIVFGIYLVTTHANTTAK